MKKIIIFTVFFILIIFSTNQIVSGETDEEKERKKDIENAYKLLKRDIPIKEPEENIDESEKEDKKDIKKKLGKLKKFLPTEEEFDEITLRSVWRYVDKQTEKNEEGDIEVIQALTRDIGRVYDPVVNKFKVATIQIEIIQFEDFKKLEKYWLDEKILV